MRSRLSASRSSSRVPLIVAQEDLLERGRAAGERRHASAHELFERRLELCRVDLLDDVLAVLRVRLDRDPREVAELCERARLDGPAVADDRHAVAQGLD